MSINNKRSYTEYTVAQPTTDFAIGFDDFDEGSKDIILVTLNGVLVETLGYAAMRKNESTVSITPAITEGTVRLTRETDIDEPFHKFTAGALFSAKSMDENFQQVRHSQQEVRDGFVFLEYNTNGIVQASKEATAQAKAATVTATASAVRAESAADTAVQAVDSLQGVVNAATTATTNANAATATATTAASQATAATTSAQNAALAATVAKQEAQAATTNANAATVETLAATGRANEAADVVADLVVGKVRAQDVSTADDSTQEEVNQKTTRKYVSALSMIADTKLKVGQFVETLGYAQLDDGGENRYIIEAIGTQVVDGGSFIKLSNGLIAKALFQGAIRPQHFGATADKDCTLEMYNLNKYINTLDGCVVEFITDIKAQPVSWKPVISTDPKIFENISAHVLHVPANSTIKMLNGSKLSVTELPRRFRNDVILCDHESHNSELINPYLEGAYDDDTVTNSARIIILEDNLSGKITTEKGNIIIPASVLKSGTTPVVVSTTSLDFFDYTGSEINPSGKDVSSLEKHAASVSMSGGTATIKLDVAVKNIVVTFRDINDVTRTIRGELFYRGEWGMGLSLRSARNLKVSGLISNNHAGDGLSISSASHYFGYNNSDIVFNNTNIKSCRRQGISICALEHAKFNDTYISDIKGTLPSAGIDIETDQGLYMEVKDVEFNKLDIRRVAGDGFIIYNLSSDPLLYLTGFVTKIYQDIRLKDVYIEDTGRSGFVVVRMPYPNKLRVDGLHIKNAGRHGISLEYPATKEGVPKNLQFHDVLVDTVGANPAWSSIDGEHVAFHTIKFTGWYSNAEAEGYVVGGMQLSDLQTINCNMYPKAGQYGIPYKPYNTIAPRSKDGVMRPIGVGSYLTPVDYTEVVTENASSIYYAFGGGNTVLHANNITSVELLSAGGENVVTHLVNMTGNVLNIKGSFAKSLFSDSFRLADGSSVTLMVDTKSDKENSWIILSVFPAVSV